MFDGTNSTPLGPSWIAATGAVIVALISGAIALVSNRKSNRNTADIEEYKSATNRDMERLKAKLSHGQLVSSTQWNVEFNAYQAIWQALVSVRDNTLDVATYEHQLAQLDLLERMPGRFKLETIKTKAKALDTSLSELSRAVQQNAPFYPPHIRTTAIEIINPLRSLTSELLVFYVAHADGNPWNDAQLDHWRPLRDQEMVIAFEAIERLEIAIRERLNSVRIIT